MASTNIDRTAVVKLALFGNVNPEEEMHDLSNQLHNFSYTVIGEGADQSYKFQIELVNTDESFLKSIVHAYSTMMSNKSGVIGQNDSLKSFPKILVQWGYNNSLSKIHTAQLSNLTYKFTQGKEKILVIEAVNSGDWAKTFYEKNAATSMTLSMASEGNELYPVVGGEVSLNVGEVLMRMSSSLLLTINGTEVINKFEDEGMAEETEIIINHLRRSQITRFNSTHSGGDKYGSQVDRAADAEAAKTNPMLFKFNAIRTFFRLFNVEVENKTDQLNIRNETFLPVQRSIPKDDAGVHGNMPKTVFLPYSQLKDSTKVGDLNPALENKAKSEIMLSFNQASSESWGNNAVNDIAIYNSRNSFNPISPESVTYKVNIEEQEQNKLKEGGRGNGYIMQATGVDSEGNTINILPYVNYQTVSVAGTDTQAGGVGSRDYLRSLDYGVQQAKKEAAVDKVLTEEQKNKYKTDDSSVETSWNDLPPEEKERLMYTNIEFSLHSPEGTSTLDTVKDIIKKFNNVVSNATNRVSITEESVVQEGDSFLEIYKTLNENPEDINTTIFKIKSGVLESSDARADLPEIVSFPEINYETSSGLVSISYGESTSIVKYFDFVGDIRVLANILGSVTLKQSLENEYEHLNSVAIGNTVVPILQMLLNDEEFKAKLEEDFDDIGGKRLLTDLQNLLNQMTPESNKDSDGNSGDKSNAEGVSSKFFEDIGYIDKYISDVNFTIRASLNQDGAAGIDGRNLTNTLRFLRAIAQKEGTKALFDRVDKTAYSSGNSTIINYSKQVAGKFEEEGVEVPNTYVYTLVGNNIFDEYYDQKTAVSSRGEISANSTLIGMDAYYRNRTEVWEIKIKTLGIPEMDTLSEISAPRLFKFDIHDLSSELSLNLKTADPTNVHWLSGVYQPLAIKHTINSSGYESEFKLIRNMRLA